MKSNPLAPAEIQVIRDVIEMGKDDGDIASIHVGRLADLLNAYLALASAAKEGGIPEEPTLCVICNKTWEDHFTLGRQKVCYNQDPSRMAIIQGTTFTAPPEPKVASLQEPEGELRHAMDSTIPFAELFERSKDDRAMIVGSEVREVIGAYRRCLSSLGDVEAELRKLRSQESK